MTPADIIDVLKQQFGDKIKSDEARRPRSVRGRRPGRPARRLPLPARRPAARASPSSTASAASITSNPTRRRSPKAGFEPHLEVVYHFSSFAHERSTASCLKLILPRWKDDKPGELPEVPSVDVAVADGRLARARGLRPVRRLVHRPPRPDAHPAVRRLGRPSAAQGLRVSAGIPRHPRPLSR